MEAPDTMATVLSSSPLHKNEEEQLVQSPQQQQQLLHSPPSQTLLHTPNNNKRSNMVRRKQQHMISDLNKRENTPSKASPSISYSDILRFLDKKGDLKQAENLKQLAKEMKTSTNKSQTMDKLIKVEEDNIRLKKELEALERELKDLSHAEQQPQPQQYLEEVSFHDSVSTQNQFTQTVVMMDGTSQTEEDFYKAKSEEQEHIIELLQHQLEHANMDLRQKNSKLKSKYKKAKEEVKRLKKGFSLDEFKLHFLELEQQNEQMLQENEDLLKSIKLLQAHSQMVKSQLKVVEREKKSLQKHSKQLERLLSFLEGVNGYVNEKVSPVVEKKRKEDGKTEELYPSDFESLMKRFSQTTTPTTAATNTTSQPLRSPSVSPQLESYPTMNNKDISVEVSQDGHVYIKGDAEKQTVLLEEFIQRHMQ